VFDSIRFYCLIIALLIYAGFSSPTPDAPAFIEGVIGALLCFAAIPGALKLAYRFNAQAPIPALYSCGLIALLYALSIPLFTGVIANMPMTDIMRDVIAVCFLFMPLFYLDLLHDNAARQKRLLITACIMGTLFALRTLAQDPSTFLAHSFAPFLHTGTNELTYLANAPTLFLTAALGYYVALSRLNLRVITAPHQALTMLILLGSSVACVAAMSITLQRASLALLVITCLYAHLHTAKTAPIKSPLVFIAVIAALLSISSFASPVLNTITALNEKTLQHGVNMRAEEWQAVIDALQSTPLGAIIGLGWGSGLFSPATSGAYVTFTHGLISASLLKTGLLGLIIIGGYLTSILWPLIQKFRQAPIMVMALCAPIAIDVTLYGAYKSLDFGVILLLAASMNHNISGENS
tara:strand:- start:17665 stop:18888 length:1224 start_codon:yes stop_codon:yes gene_type:complete